MENQMNVSNQNTQQMGQNPANQPVNIPEKPKANYLMIAGIVLACFVVFGFGGYYLGKNYSGTQQPINTTEKQPNPTSSHESGATGASPTSSIQQKSSEIQSIDDKTYKYVNYLIGFSIKYPKYNLIPSTCEERQNDKNGSAPMRVFEVPNENSLYISEESIVSVKNKQLAGGGYQYDFSTCKVTPNSLDLIRNGYDNGIPSPNNISKPIALQFDYLKIENDNDLQALAQSMYKGCYVGQKQLIKNSTDVYQIKLVNKNGQPGSFDDPNTTCLTNFVYMFLYSPKNKAAVITSGFQDAPFNGTNGQAEPEIEFLLK